MARNQRKQQWRRHESSRCQGKTHRPHTPPNVTSGTQRTMENYKFNVCQLWMHLTPRAHLHTHRVCKRTIFSYCFRFVSHASSRRQSNVRSHCNSFWTCLLFSFFRVFPVFVLLSLETMHMQWIFKIVGKQPALQPLESLLWVHAPPSSSPSPIHTHYTIFLIHARAQASENKNMKFIRVIKFSCAYKFEYIANAVRLACSSSSLESVFSEWKKDCSETSDWW